MSLSAKQWDFLLDVSELIAFIDTVPGLTATGGELSRTADQQAIHVKNGRSKTMNSRHLKRLAIDLNFFYDGEYIGCWDKVAQIAILEPVGVFWESMTVGNRWGGHYTSFFDAPHFERL